MRFNTLLRCFLFAATCVGAHAHAQVDSFSLNFGEIRLDHQAVRPGGVPFALDIVHGENSSVSLRPIGIHHVTLKRGVIHPADPAPQSVLFFETKDARGGTAGLLTLDVDQSSGSSGSVHFAFMDGSVRGVPSLHVGGVNVLLGDGSVRFLSNSADVRLSGEPAELFNQPGPGEPLEAILPVPAPGQTIQLTLKVMDDRGESMSMPVRIARPR